MHLIKATVIKAILTGAAATATVSGGVVLTAAAVEFFTGNYAEASKEIEIEGEDLAFNAEIYIPSQEGNDDADLIDITDSDHEMDDTGTAHNNMAAVDPTDINSPVKTSDPDKTADSSLADVAGNIGNGPALADNTANTDGSLDSTNNTVNTAGNASDSSANTAADTGNSSVNTAADIGNSSVNTAVSADESAAPVADMGNSPVYTAANSGNGSDTASSSAASLPHFYNTTSIYDDDGSLIRVEYYVEDQNLPAEYSSVADYDKDTNSYTETVYRYDEENDVSVVVRTDTYVDGELVSSEVP